MHDKQHINFKALDSRESYTSKNTPRFAIPVRNSNHHSQNLMLEFNKANIEFNEQKHSFELDCIQSEGIYLSIFSSPNYELPLDSLDTVDVKLASVKKHKNNNVEEAIIFIPEDKRVKFLKKLTDYMATMDNKEKKNPKNMKLINSIDRIEITSLKDFWTDSQDLFPNDNNQLVWWELWLRKIGDDPSLTFEKVKTLSEYIPIEIDKNYLNFFNNMVVLVKAKASDLEKSIFLMSNLSELRYVADVPTFFIELNEKEQYEWVEELNSRILVKKDPTTSICILDSGVNYDHPLLDKVSNDHFSISYNPLWPKYDVKKFLIPYNPHGSLQAGIAGFGDLQQCLTTSDNIYLTHLIESGRILPPHGSNKPELYGSITTQTADKISIINSDIKNRIFSLAITANSNNTGAPSSWSAAIDNYTYGNINDNNKRLFLISAGNNRNLDVNIDIWDQAHLAKIEDPAQSWNSITVGSITNLTSLTDPSYSSWQPWSQKGDLSPSARSSVNWEWRKQAPYKPDFVLEGGNRLISTLPPIECTNHDDVSILTTSGDINTPFDTHLDSSAACALASYYAAKLSDTYPEYWPETIRGLLIHSCKFNSAIKNRYTNLINNYHFNQKQALEILLRTVGFGIPDLKSALKSSESHAHIVIQDELKPFRSNKDNVSLNEMHFIQLPWPKLALQYLGNKKVSLKVTLSYFIEPNPQNKGYRSRFSYQSFGLRFKMLSPNQTLPNFKASINKKALYDEYDGSDSDSSNWVFGPNLRTRGSIHSDVWKGSAIDLMTMDYLAIYPVSGWWKSAKAKERWKNKIRYSLIVSIESIEDININLYSEILAVTQLMNNIQIPIEINKS